MSEKITAKNLDEVVDKNILIKDEINKKVASVYDGYADLGGNFFYSFNYVAIQKLREYGLIQIPLENKYWSGAVFAKNGKKIPVINTAIPRVNQYFTAWHEVYHLLYDDVSFDYVIETEIMVEERKADYFASLVLLKSLLSYYKKLPKMDFLSKIFYCMDAFGAPYKAILIMLYENAKQNNNQKLMTIIKKNFDNSFFDLASEFRRLGLDDDLAKPSYVVNVAALKIKIQDKIKQNPEFSYNFENEQFLDNVVQELNLLIKKKDI